jgi:hypothetical protein
MSVLDRLMARRAVEGLRSGVPSVAAVRALGWPYPQHVQRLDALLDSARDDVPGPRGLLVKGDFGSGKSHLLGFFEQHALREHFVVSKVSVSKETPLFKPEAVLAAAVRDSKIPGVRGSLLHELTPQVDFGTAAADRLVHWARSAPGMMAATLFLVQRTADLGDEELTTQIIDWWSGDEKLTVPDVKKGLLRLDAQGSFDVKVIKQVDLPALRAALTSQLIRAAGFAGWVILLDELELIGKYSRLQRASSYAELARWFGMGSPVGTSVACVGTMTDDFPEVVLNGPKGDRAALAPMLGSFGKYGAEQSALIERGMDVISGGGAVFLSGPKPEMLEPVQRRVAEVYAAAFDWVPPVSAPRFAGIATPMRTYIKTWIYEWDLIRLGVTARPEISVEALPQSYDEDDDLELGAAALDASDA